MWVARDEDGDLYLYKEKPVKKYEKCETELDKYC